MQIRIPPAVDTPFSEIPSGVREALAKGFSHLAELPTASLYVLAGQVSRWIDPQYSRSASVALDPPVEAEILDLIVPAVAFQATAIFSPVRQIPLDAFVAEAISAGIVHQEHAGAVHAFGDNHLGARSEEIEDALTRSYSSTQVIPSFQGIQAVVDLRVTSTSKSRTVVMPMAVVVLLTDIEDKQLVFQMTARDVQKLQKRLDVLSKQLDLPENMTITKGTTVAKAEKKEHR